MSYRYTFESWIFCAACALALNACGGGGGSSMSSQPVTGLTDAALTSNGVIAAAHNDPNLQNPWGVAAAPGGPFWIADNNSNKATVYDGTGAVLAPTVTISPGTSGPANATGEVYNGTADFMITTGLGTAPAQFIFAGEGGTINAWSQSISGTTADVEYDDGAGGAVYKALVLANNGTANHLYATDLHNARIDVFDGTFHKVALAGSFADPTVPAGFAPFGMALINSQLYVTYAKQDATAHDEVLGAGLGYVNVFDLNGNFVKRFASAGTLNAPWGMTMAPAGFATMAGQLLIGNFGDGVINGFDPMTGVHMGTVGLASGKQLVIPGLWSLTFGNGAPNQPASTLFYTAGPNNQVDGVFGGVKVTTSSMPACTGYGC